MSLLGAAAAWTPFSPAQRISVPLFSPAPNPALSPAWPTERAAFLPLRPTAPGSQAGAGVVCRFGMLNIKQAKPGVSGPEATRAALQGSRESPRVYLAGWGWGRGGRGDAVCKISPTLRSRRGLGMGGVLRRGRSASLGSWSELRCPPPYVGKLLALPAL